MGIHVASRQAASYQVTTPVYEGPLDLLLQLIERAELDITKLALAQVTDQYLAHLRELQIPQEQGNRLSAEEVSAFLVIAAKLVQIKSEALLPRPPVRQPGEEDPGEALALQLLAYKRYRKVADRLAEREEAGLRSYLRLAPAPKSGAGPVDLSGVGLLDLVAAARAVFHHEELKPSLGSVVSPPSVTIREKISLIAHLLRERGRASFRAMLGNRRSRLDIVVTFLAVLELIKRHLIYAHQESLFGDIDIESKNGWNENEDFELEFGE
jgi:segregation and condensation protein A